MEDPLARESSRIPPSADRQDNGVDLKPNFRASGFSNGDGNGRERSFTSPEKVNLNFGSMLGTNQKPMVSLLEEDDEGEEEEE